MYIVACSPVRAAFRHGEYIMTLNVAFLKETSLVQFWLSILLYGIFEVDTLIAICSERDEACECAIMRVEKTMMSIE